MVEGQSAVEVAAGDEQGGQFVTQTAVDLRRFSISRRVGQRRPLRQDLGQQVVGRPIFAKGLFQPGQPSDVPQPFSSAESLGRRLQSGHGETHQPVQAHVFVNVAVASFG